MIAIRGAVRVPENDAASIQAETRRLLEEIQTRNALSSDRVISALFTMTPDLDADFPAHAARQLGWLSVPMLGAVETAVPGAPDRMIRVLLHADVEPPARHVYLGDAARLRPDLAGQPGQVDGVPHPDRGAAPDGPDPTPGAAGRTPVRIVGLGLIGGSLAHALARHPAYGPVRGEDRDPGTLDAALAAGAIDGVAGPAHEGLVLLCLPVDGILRWLEETGPGLAPDTIVIDVGSTKTDIARAMSRLPEGVEAIAAHPIAGAETAGFGGAHAALLGGATWAVVETDRTGPRAREAVETLVGALGGRCVEVDAEVHDRTLAETSHLPWLVAAALARRARTAPFEPAVLSGPGLRDTTRLAGSSAELVGGFVRTNWRHLREAAAGFQRELELLIASIEEGLETGEPDALVALVEDVRAARGAIGGVGS